MELKTTNATLIGLPLPDMDIDKRHDGLSDEYITELWWQHEDFAFGAVRLPATISFIWKTLQEQGGMDRHRLTDTVRAACGTFYSEKYINYVIWHKDRMNKFPFWVTDESEILVNWPTPWEDEMRREAPKFERLLRKTQIDPPDGIVEPSQVLH